MIDFREREVLQVVSCYFGALGKLSVFVSLDSIACHLLGFAIAAKIVVPLLILHEPFKLLDKD